MKDFKKYFILNAPPDEVYLALTNPFTISLWTNEEAEMSTEPGTEFSMLGGNISGKNLEFEQDKKIVQQWYFGDEPTPSIVTIKLHLHGEEGTSMEVKHTNIPDEAYEDMVEGWNEIYLAGLDEFFNE
jgi:activator of HSP90 ATPase